MCTPKGTRWRRDLTGEQKSYLRGKRYQQEKRQDGGHGDQKSGTETQYPKTHQRLAKEYGVAPSTIQADAQFADALDTLAALRADLREAVLTRQTYALCLSSWRWRGPIAGVGWGAGALGGSGFPTAARALRPFLSLGYPLKRVISRVGIFMTPRVGII